MIEKNHMAKTDKKYHLSVWWGDDVVNVELFLSEEDWGRIMSGEKKNVIGDGYFYEGEKFQDIWRFSGGLDGELIVSYDEYPSEGWDGDGWIGTVREALVDEE